MLRYTYSLLTFPIFTYIISAPISASNVHTDENFKVIYAWHQVNFTWPTSEEYNSAIQSQCYVPGSVPIAGLKIYNNKIYLAMPRLRPGNPVTLGYIKINESVRTDPLVTPFPNWDLNDITSTNEEDCSKLQNVQSMEIDRNGIMWIIDGLRSRATTSCPAKLVLIDLNSSNSEILHTYTFPQHICSSDGGFLNDIVIDHADATSDRNIFAYITDHSSIDPGLIVYSLLQNKSWKLRDKSMYPEADATNFTVDGLLFDGLAPIDGIALSPPVQNGEKTLYYCSLTGFNLYSIPTNILKNESLSRDGAWRLQVKAVGKKQAQSDGLVVDNKGDLYYGLLPLYGVAKWNTKQPFPTSKIVDTDRLNLVWTDSFAFDSQGFLYLLSNNIHKFFNPTYEFKGNQKLINIAKLFTGSNSYLYK